MIYDFNMIYDFDLIYDFVNRRFSSANEEVGDGYSYARMKVDVENYLIDNGLILFDRSTMATSVEDCLEIIRLVQETGLKYMMMETVVYSREFLFMKKLYEDGELGKLQFLQASHQQDMDGWPGYWPGLPPMYYATHCVGPVLGLPKQDAKYVSCFPSGTIREEMHHHYNSPFAVETTHIKMRNRYWTNSN